MAVETNESERNPRGRGDRLRERLIEAGLELVDEHGDAAQVTIRAVTRRAGVSPTAFYLHFDKREDLLMEVVDRCFMQLRRQLASGAAQAERPREALLGGGLAYIRFAREAPARYALIFGTQSPLSVGPDGEQPDQVPEGEAAFEDLIALVAGYLGQDEADERTRESAVGIWTGIHGFVTLQNCRPKIEWPDDERFTRDLAQAWLGSA